MNAPDIRREAMRIAGERVSRDRVIEVRHPYDGTLVGTVPKGTVELALSLQRLSPRDGFLDQLPGESGARLALAARVAGERPESAFIECQVQPLHDTHGSTRIRACEAELGMT